MNNKPVLFSPTSKDHQKNRCLIGSVIVLEGLIGAGKSTLGKSLEVYLKSANLPAKFYPEFKNFSLLKQYIGNMEKYAYSFQIIMVRERLRIYREANEFAKKGGIAIVDRSLIGDYTFARMQQDKGLISDDEFTVYLNMIYFDLADEPHLTLFLKCEPKLAYERMKKRSIQSEVDGYTLEYFITLNKYYEESLNIIRNSESFFAYQEKDELTSSQGVNNISHLTSGCDNIIDVEWDVDKEVHNNIFKSDICEDFLNIVRKNLFTLT